MTKVITILIVLLTVVRACYSICVSW